MSKISASIVIYNPDPQEILHNVSLLAGSSVVPEIYVIDNSPADRVSALIKDLQNVHYIKSPQNIGYGSAHNLGIKASISKGFQYHVVVNPDIEVDTDTLKTLAGYMDQHTDIGLIMPRILYKNGEMQYLCKRLPTPFDLIGRRFLPGFLRPSFRRSFERYELRHKDYNQTMDVPNLSGCFMFLRNSVVKQIGGFDERYFMYLEDTDLCRRIGQISRTVYHPETFVFHGYAKDSYKNPKLLKYHIISAIQYFNKWGWLFDRFRNLKNKTL